MGEFEDTGRGSATMHLENSRDPGQFNIEHLKKVIPYKWRVQSFSKNKPKASCVAYVDARQVQDLLDDVVGPENWQDTYQEHKGSLFCSIGIRIHGQWVWKTDCGSESNMDPKKGESSDAFKRAAVKWGAGRFLYSKKIIYVTSDKVKEDKNYPKVIDSNGKQVWDLTEHIFSTGLDNRPVVEPDPPKISVKSIIKYIGTCTIVDQLKSVWSMYNAVIDQYTTDDQTLIEAHKDNAKHTIERGINSNEA